MKHKIGDIIFTSGETFFERLIQKFTFGRKNHVAIVVDIHKDKAIIKEATEEGVITHKQSLDYGWNIGVVKRRPLTKQKQSKLTQYAKKYKDAPYDWRSIRFIAYDILTLTFWRRITKFRNTTDKVICSELVERLHYGVDKKRLVKHKSFEYVTPMDQFRSNILYKLE